MKFTQPLQPRKYSTVDNAVVLTGLAVLSPIAGLALEMVMAWRFGGTETVDSFRIASLVLVFGNQIFLGQVLPHVVVPLFSEYSAKKLDQDAWRLVASLFGIFGLISLAFAIWVWLYPATLVDLLGPGLSGSGRANGFLFVRYFSLAFVLMALSGVASGVLYCHQVFWPPVAAPILTNLFAIAAIIAVGREWGSGSLVPGILLGSLAMFVLHLYYLLRIARTSNIDLPALLKLGPWDGVARAVRLSAPLLGMIFIGQWSIIINNRVLSEMPPGTLANFGYAWKLLALVGILPTSLATVIFPAFSAVGARRDAAELSRLTTRAVRMTLLLTVPLAAFLYVMRAPIVSLLFERGVMSKTAVTDTIEFFGLLLIGATASVLMGILYKIFFSVQDTKSPAIAAFVSALAATWLVPYGASVAGAIGVAWAYTAIACVSALGLFAYYIWRYRVMRFWDLLAYSGLLTLLCVGIAVPAIALRSLFESNYTTVLAIMTLFELVVIAMISILIGYYLSRLLGIRETSELWEYVRWRGAKVLSRKGSAQNE